MTIEELVDSHGVTLAYFDNALWHRPGVYIKEINIPKMQNNASYTTN